MPLRQPPLPDIWLISDARNDAALEAALARLPRGSGFVFRHYHLDVADRRARFDRLARIARRKGHVVILSRGGSGWHADGIYRAPTPARRSRLTLSIVTAHSLREIGAAHRARADAIMLSPVFPTVSHPGARTLGPLRLRLLAARAKAPVIALGGMNPRRARRLRWRRWAAIDGLSAPDRHADS